MKPHKNIHGFKNKLQWNPPKYDMLQVSNTQKLFSIWCYLIRECTYKEGFKNSAGTLYMLVNTIEIDPGPIKLKFYT